MIICRRLWLNMIDLFNTEVRLLLMVSLPNEALKEVGLLYEIIDFIFSL
jgi:hypothetical protein